MTDTMEIVDRRVVWTPEQLETVKQLWANGLSFQQIADQFVDVSRNKICGLVHRNQFKRAEGYVKPAPAPKPARAPKPERNSSQRPFKFVADAAPICLPVEETSLHLTIDDLKPHHCRWPELDGPEQTYCGHQVKEDRSYCKFHCSIAHVPIQPRKRPFASYSELGKNRNGIFGRTS